MKPLARVLVFLVAAGSVFLAAQEKPTQPRLPRTGAASLRVQVLGANHNFLPTRALVRLHDPREMQEMWDTTHDRSETIFNRLSPGTWEVEVSAAGYDTVVTHVEIFDEPVQYAVQVTLKADPGVEMYNAPEEKEVSANARKESQQGLVDLQGGHIKDAEKHLRKAVQDAPQSAQIAYLLGVALLQSKNVPESEQFFLQAISLDPRHVQALTAMGGLRLQEQDIPGAIKFLDQAIAANPKAWRAHWLLANARFSQEQFEPAVSEAELAIRLSNDSAPAARLILGEALGNLGRYSEAISALQAFLQQAPTSSDAPAVRKMIAEMKEALHAAPVATPEPAALSLSALPLAAPPMLALISPTWAPPDVDSVLPPVAASVACPAAQVLTGAGARAKELVDALGSFSATEVQTHEQLDVFGKPTTRETRKSEYVAGISSAGKLQLQELRRDLSGRGAFPDGIVTRGPLSLALIFDPSAQHAYQFHCEGLGDWKGQPAWLVYFRQVDRVGDWQSPDIGLDFRAVALRGRAWIGTVDFPIMHIEADLAAPMPDIGLLSEHESGEYGPVVFPSKKEQLWLPQESQIYFGYRGLRYRFTDQFTDFKLLPGSSGEKLSSPAAQE